MPINKDKIEQREQVEAHRPKFKRPESWRYKRLETSWRKPKGIDNHIRKQWSRGRPGIVKVGYGGPKASRGLHPSGYTDNLVFNKDNLDGLDPKVDGIRMGHSVGAKKRREIMQVAMEKKFKVFNARVSLIGSKS
jgi:large subunit ribosomal protein L32e